MRRTAYVLIVLALWAQFDDALLTLASAFQSASLTIYDDDECLPPTPLTRQEQLGRRLPQSVRVKPPATNVSLARRSAPSEQSLTTPFTSPPLYVFMSLQI
jgi:hypothetical protein